MTDSRTLNATLLGITEPWGVELVEMKQDAGEVHVRVALPTNTRWVCPECHAAAPIHDHQERTWRHFDTCQFRPLIHARVPRLNCATHGIRQEKRKASQTWREQRERGVLKMPAFKGRLSEQQMLDLVAYVMAASGMPEPEDSLVARGLERAEALGCVGCHGAGGRLATPNPGSLKGYVPPWDGADFPELVASRREFDEWVEDGVSRRFEHNQLARFFLDRAVLKMPAYRKHLEQGDLDALWAYLQWLRSPESTTTAHEHGE